MLLCNIYLATLLFKLLSNSVVGLHASIDSTRHDIIHRLSYKSCFNLWCV